MWQVFDADLAVLAGNGCAGGGKGYNRALCIESNVIVNGCRWAGKPRGCRDTCAPGEVLISQNSWIGGASSGCSTGSYSSYCCQYIEASGSAISNCPVVNSDNSLSGGFHNPRIVEKSFVPFAQGTDLECASYLNEETSPISQDQDPTPGFYPIDIGPVILNALPGEWQFNPVFKNYLWIPNQNIQYPQPNPNPTCTSTTTVTVESTTITNKIQTRTCDFKYYPQACGHYSSVARGYHGAIDTLYCKVSSTLPARGAPQIWDQQHDVSWRYWIPNFYKPNGKLDVCNRSAHKRFTMSFN